MEMVNSILEYAGRNPDAFFAYAGVTLFAAYSILELYCGSRNRRDMNTEDKRIKSNSLEIRTFD